MVTNTIKEEFNFLRTRRSRFFIVSVLYILVALVFFGLFVIAKFSLLYANVLKSLQFFLIYFLGFPFLKFLAGANFKESFKPIGKAFLYAVIKYLSIIILVQGIRLLAESFWPCVLMIFLTFIIEAFFLYLAPALLLSENSAWSSLKESAQAFCKAPILGFALFVFLIVCRVLALYSFFVVPTWALADITLYFFYKGITEKRDGLSP